MEEYEKYFESVVNDFYDELYASVDKIKKEGACPNCGGIYYGDNCLFCCTENKVIKRNIEYLKSKIDRLYEKIVNLPQEVIKVNKLFNLLYSITNLRLDEVEDLLEKYNYKELFNQYENEMIPKIGTNYKYSLLDINVLETSISTKKDPLTLFPLFAKEAIDGNISISYDYFKMLVRNYVLELMKKFSLTPECNILPVEELMQYNENSTTVAQAGLNKIHISEEEIQLLYYKKSNELINSIFHELKHIEQFTKFYFMINLHPFVVTEIKEYILTKYVPEYYKQNYKYLSFEIEASYYALIRTKDFLVDLGFEINQENFDRQLADLNENLNIKERYLDNEVTSVDELFDKTILDHKELLDRYKGLKLLYKVEDGLVYPKNSDELIDDFMKISEDDNYSIEEKEKYKTFYNYYVSRTRR